MVKPLNSAIYEGNVRHRRFYPKYHELNYSLFMMYLDLDEIENVCELHPRISYEKWNIGSFFRSDYLRQYPEQPLKRAVSLYIQDLCGTLPRGPIRVLTHLRYLGICFNPVSFYYCFNEDGTDVDFIVAEVNNTPWNERYQYLMCNLPQVKNTADLHQEKKSIIYNHSTKHQLYSYELQKQFHVSPFNPMNMEYQWRFKIPGETLSVHMENYHQDASINHQTDLKHFDATLNLSKKTLHRKNLQQILKRYPSMTGMVLLGIYSHALRLWFKKTPFYSHPKHTT